MAYLLGWLKVEDFDKFKPMFDELAEERDKRRKKSCNIRT